MKFGGSSVGDADKIKNACNIIKSRLDKKPVVVVSAVKGITDKLIDAAEKAANDNDVSKELEEINFPIFQHLLLLEEENCDQTKIMPKKCIKCGKLMCSCNKSNVCSKCTLEKKRNKK